MNTKTKRLATAGIFTGVMFILGYLESLLPSFFAVPGIKPGFANIPVIIALFILDWRLAASMSFVRILLSGLTFTGMFACIYSLAGAFLSITIMLVLKKTGRFSTTGLSIAGGVAHNIGQLLVACFVLNSSVLYYLPVLIISGLLAGALTGFIAGLVLKRIRAAEKSIR